MQLKLPHPSIASIFWCVWTHPIDPMDIHFLRCAHSDKHTRTQDTICNQHLCCHYVKCWFPCGTKTITYASFNHIELLSLTNWHYAYQRWHLHLSERCYCWSNVIKFISLILRNSRICYLRCNSSQRKDLLQLTPHWSISPLSNWGIWLLTQTCRCVFTWLCQCHLELEGDKKRSFFYLGHFSS
jgi:hypothetical protein